MSMLAKDLTELRRLSDGGAGSLTLHMLREIAANLIAEGVRDERAGC